MKTNSPPRTPTKVDTPRIIGTLSTQSNQPGRRSKARAYDSFGKLETHRVISIELKPEDRATLEGMAKRYRLKSLTRFLEGCLATEDRKGNEQVLFRVYED